MGCAASRVDDNEAVQLCRDRKNFIKQALDLRGRLASDHVAYIQSLEQVSAALVHYVEADYRHDFFFDSYAAPPSRSLKKLMPEINRVTLRGQKQGKLGKTTVQVVNHLRSRGNPPVTVEEEPESEESGSIGSCYSASQWDHPWNPFPSLDSYGYPSWTSFDRIIDNDDIAKLRRIRDEEGIPELEAVHENTERTENENQKTERSHVGVQVGGESLADSSREFEKVWEGDNKSLESECIEASRNRGTRDLETPGSIAYASMAEVMKEMETQFMRICESAEGVSVLLEASTGRMLNKNASLRSTASDSSASRFGQDYFILNSHQATLDRLNEWEKKLYEEVKVDLSVDYLVYGSVCFSVLAQFPLLQNADAENNCLVKLLSPFPPLQNTIVGLPSTAFPKLPPSCFPNAAFPPLQNGAYFWPSKTPPPKQTEPMFVMAVAVEKVLFTP